MLEDAATTPNQSMFKMTTDPKKAPDDAALVSITFKDGVPVRIVNKKDKIDYTDSLDIFLYANDVAGKNGCGR